MGIAGIEECKCASLLQPVLLLLCVNAPPQSESTLVRFNQIIVLGRSVVAQQVK